MATINAIGSNKPIEVAFGGTGDSSVTAYAVLCGGTSSTNPFQSIAGVGTAGQVLTSNGAAALPTFQNSGGGGGISTINGNSGSVTGSTVTFSGPGTLLFSGSGATMTFNTTDGGNNIIIAQTSTVSGSSNILIGESSTLISGNSNTLIGSGSGNNSNMSDTIGIGISTATNRGNNGSVFIGNGVGDGTVANAGQDVFIGHQVNNLSTFDNGNNVAIGYQAYLNGGSGQNVIIGSQAAQSLAQFTASGNSNCVIIGYQAGSAYNGFSTNEVSNIVIGSNVAGTNGEAHACRIGNGTGTGTGQLNKTFISGIQGITVTGTAVLVSASDQLGIAVSSERFKENISDLASTKVLQLQPKKFNYKSGEDKSPQTGLIAEEVYSVMPELVFLDKEGLPQSVKYHDLPVLLLLEIKKLRKELDDLKEYVNKTVLNNGRRF